MEDNTLIALIAAGSAFIGVLVGSAVSLVIAVMNQRGAREDARRARVIEIRERRCAQAEDLVALMTRTFYRVYSDCLANASEQSIGAAAKRAKRMVREHEEADFRTHVGGPAIVSLTSPKLEEAWLQLGDILGEIGDLNEKALMGLARRQPPEWVKDIHTKANDIKVRYNDTSGRFYAQLDDLRQKNA